MAVAVAPGGGWWRWRWACWWSFTVAEVGWDGSTDQAGVLGAGMVWVSLIVGGERLLVMELIAACGVSLMSADETSIRKTRGETVRATVISDDNAHDLLRLGSRDRWRQCTF